LKRVMRAGNVPFWIELHKQNKTGMIN